MSIQSLVKRAQALSRLDHGDLACACARLEENARALRDVVINRNDCDEEVLDLRAARLTNTLKALDVLAGGVK
jgi:hypothetical protein